MTGTGSNAVSGLQLLLLLVPAIALFVNACAFSLSAYQWTRRKQIYDHPFGAFMRLAHALNAAIATKFFTGRDATAASGA